MTETRTIVGVRYYEKVGDAYVRFDTAAGETIDVANGPNTGASRALRVIAYLGARPSDLDPVVGKELPVETEHGGPFPTDEVLEGGHTALAESEWYWKDIEAIKEENSPDPEDVGEEVEDGGS